MPFCDTRLTSLQDHKHQHRQFPKQSHTRSPSLAVGSWASYKTQPTRPPECIPVPATEVQRRASTIRMAYQQTVQTAFLTTLINTAMYCLLPALHCMLQAPRPGLPCACLNRDKTPPIYVCVLAQAHHDHPIPPHALLPAPKPSHPCAAAQRQ